jgi:phosphate transport system protein
LLDERRPTVGVDLALKAAEVVQTRNIALAIEMEDDDEEMDGLHGGMFMVRMDRAWPHATTPSAGSDSLAVIGLRCSPSGRSTP